MMTARAMIHQRSLSYSEIVLEPGTFLLLEI